MSSSARYYQRTPRYVFRPEDRSLMRFAPMESRGEASPAHVRDLSSTGLSFVVQSDEAPAEGSVAKVEFGVPGKHQIAWFANVMRVEQRSEWEPDLGERDFTLVAVHFRQLPMPYQRAIKNGLDQKRSLEEQLLGGQVETTSLLGCCGLAMALFSAFFWMSLPPETWLGLFR